MPIPKSAKLGITGLLTVLIFGALLLPMARADKPVVRMSEPNTIDIVKKVKLLYAGLDSYSSQGEASLSVNRLSEATEGDFKKARKSKKDFDDSIKRYSFNGTFNVKLARPDYYIEWEKRSGNGFNLAGAIWSEGEQNFVFISNHKFLVHNRHASLASVMNASNISIVIPFLFVPIESKILDLSKGVNREDDEIIDGEDYYVISNSDMKYWISKKSFLIRKRQQVLSVNQIPPEILQDAAIHQLGHLGRPVTNGTIRQYREEYKAKYKLSSMIETVITEIHRNIVINMPIDFKPYVSKYADVEIIKPTKKSRKPRMVSNRESTQTNEVSPEELAVQVVLEWLKLIDGGDYDKSWEQTAEYFKAAISKEQWNKSLLEERVLPGRVILRKVKSKKYEFLKNMFYGEYIVVKFDTSFENKADVIETVILMLDENGSWHVCGYYIK